MSRARLSPREKAINAARSRRDRRLKRAKEHYLNRTYKIDQDFHLDDAAARALPDTIDA